MTNYLGSAGAKTNATRNVTRIVLDSSALLAYLNDEPGGDDIAPLLEDAMLSTVNVAEVVTRLAAHGQPVESIREIFDALDLEIVAFDRGSAEETGMLVTATRAFGLSLGDRACLTLAMREKLTAVTADRVWKNLKLPIEIRVIR